MKEFSEIENVLKMSSLVTVYWQWLGTELKVRNDFLSEI